MVTASAGEMPPGRQAPRGACARVVQLDRAGHGALAGVVLPASPWPMKMPDPGAALGQYGSRPSGPSSRRPYWPASCPGR